MPLSYDVVRTSRDIEPIRLLASDLTADPARMRSGPAAAVLEAPTRPGLVVSPDEIRLRAYADNPVPRPIAVIERRTADLSEVLRCSPYTLDPIGAPAGQATDWRLDFDRAEIDGLAHETMLRSTALVIRFVDLPDGVQQEVVAWYIVKPAQVRVTGEASTLPDGFEGLPPRDEIGIARLMDEQAGQAAPAVAVAAGLAIGL